jgi:hypothetical protein
LFQQQAQRAKPNPPAISPNYFFNILRLAAKPTLINVSKCLGSLGLGFNFTGTWRTTQVESLTFGAAKKAFAGTSQMNSHSAIITAIDNVK